MYNHLIISINSNEFLSFIYKNICISLFHFWYFISYCTHSSSYCVLYGTSIR